MDSVLCVDTRVRLFVMHEVAVSSVWARPDRLEVPACASILSNGRTVIHIVRETGPSARLVPKDSLRQVVSTLSLAKQQQQQHIVFPSTK